MSVRNNISRPAFALLLLALPLSLLLVGCGGGGSNGSGSSSTPAAPLSVSSTLPDGLTATLAENTATVRVGGGVTYTLTLANNTVQPITFVPAYEVSADAVVVPAVGGALVIENPSGTPVHPPTSGETPAVLGTGTGPDTTLAPGQSASGTVSSDNVFSTPGIYSTTASFTVQAGNGLPNTVTAVGPLNVTVQ